MLVLVDIRQLHLHIGSLNIHRSLTLHDKDDDDDDDNDDDDDDDDDGDDGDGGGDGDDGDDANNPLPLLHFACH